MTGWLPGSEEKDKQHSSQKMVLKNLVQIAISRLAEMYLSYNKKKDFSTLDYLEEVEHISQIPNIPHDLRKHFHGSYHRQGNSLQM